MRLPLPTCAAEERLHGVRRTGVVFRDADDLLILRRARRALGQRRLDGLEADCETGALVAVKFRRAEPFFLVIHTARLPLNLL